MSMCEHIEFPPWHSTARSVFLLRGSARVMREINSLLCRVVFNYVHMQLCVHTNSSYSHLQVVYSQERSHCIHA
jgi:hypothetical protein